MTSVVLPFPSTRRRGFVLRQARRMAELNQSAAENLLRGLLDQQSATMLRKAIAPDLIAAELTALEAAIRTELWRLVLLTPGGAA
jgi:Family of unknown function (DUF6074)